MTPEKIPVSVVIPCFRCCVTIDRAIDSVVRQTMHPREIILVDDFSGDGTLKKLNAIAENYPQGWIKILSLEKNSGPASARNFGWEHASGEYIAFLDADDAWHPRKLELQFGWMSTNAEVVLTGHGTKQLRNGAIMPSQIEQFEMSPVGKIKHLLFNQFSTRSVMVRRDLPFRFQPGKRYTEDYLLWLQIVLSGNQTCRANVALAFSYKSDFGAGGLSGNLWKLEKGEIDTYCSLYQDRLISFFALVGLVLFSVAKHFRRVALSWVHAVLHFKSGEGQ